MSRICEVSGHVCSGRDSCDCGEEDREHSPKCLILVMWTNVHRKCVIIPTSEPFGFLFYTPWNKGSDYKVNLKISILRLAIDFLAAKATLQSQMSVCSSVTSAKPLNSLKSLSFIVQPSSFTILHSSFIILRHSSFILPSFRDF